jgi:hypothetical protein
MIEETTETTEETEETPEPTAPEPPKTPPECPHDWRVVDTRVDPAYGTDRNPHFSLDCRKCGRKGEARGQKKLKEMMSGRRPDQSSGLG